MDKNKALPILDKLNRVISGSEKIRVAIAKDYDNVNIYKAINAAMLNSKLLAESMKELIDLSISPGGESFLHDFFKEK